MLFRSDPLKAIRDVDYFLNLVKKAEGKLEECTKCSKMKKEDHPEMNCLIEHQTDHSEIIEKEKQNDNVYDKETSKFLNK